VRCSRSRADLTPVKPAMHITRRKELHEKLYPETKNGANQHTRKRVSQLEKPSKTFVIETARKTAKAAAPSRRPPCAARSSRCSPTLRNRPIASVIKLQIEVDDDVGDDQGFDATTPGQKGTAGATAAPSRCEQRGMTRSAVRTPLRVSDCCG
jgi:hypothetical protein